MIICGIIQSPKRDDDRLLIEQVSGGEQTPDTIINGQIDLTSNGRCINDGDDAVRGWLPKTLSPPSEFYVQTATDSRDYLGRRILLGIYLKKESNDLREFSDTALREILGRFSLEMDAAAVTRVVQFVKRRFGSAHTRRKLLSCSVFFMAAFLLLLALVLFLFQ